ncbi:hypothetical protein ZPR_2221 [Zunongwangia profunda SM-A87]|uniref:Uncharacterized protein n=1 Tax=Zunongwangia profunda (strain DSM 18752 / CCTCC AB 206139 / SM-A87) TaxID=655815 RepID=D5BBU6_ZUNPS|nr:hypothetical protein ZPR_2221 [Zunongwangia profunda SM-A87]
MNAEKLNTPTKNYGKEITVINYQIYKKDIESKLL